MDTCGQVAYDRFMAWIEERTLAKPARTLDGERFAPALPLGRSETIRRHLEEMRIRRAREGRELMPAPEGGDSLGWATYFEMMYDMGALTPHGPSRCEGQAHG